LYGKGQAALPMLLGPLKSTMLLHHEVTGEDSLAVKYIFMVDPHQKSSIFSKDTAFSQMVS